jgi:uncharacterized lipoprotein YmbA
MRRGPGALGASALVACALAASCGGTVPETRYYQLAEPPPAQVQGGDVTLMLEQLETDDAYADERMVYRTTPYRFDYYQYHRWSVSPGVMITNYLEQALENSGRFRAVLREPSASAVAVLRGRVIAIEEVDTSRTQWAGRLVIELTLTDAKSRGVLWTQQLAETERMPAPTPEALAKAISAAMARIAARAVPRIAEAARQAQGQAQAPAQALQRQVH